MNKNRRRKRASAPMTIGEYRQKSTKKNARELLLLSDVMVPDMVVICDIGIIIGMEHVI